MRSRSTHNAYAVSLFPFLAVLICTMGILVALLVVAVREADQSVKGEVAETRAVKQQEIDEVQELIEDNLFRVEGLQGFRPDVVDRIRNAREKRAHVQTHLRELDDQLKELSRQMEQLDHPPENASMTLAQMDAEQSLLKEQILAAREQLEELKQQRPDEQVVYSIVPTDAAGVTRRRPIYIECVDDRVIIQPHGIEFRIKEFVPPIHIGNPLDAAMIAIREYWNKYQLAGVEADAYPLLVVRPSGAQAYVMARHAIQSWDDEFGYELIVEDLELDFGPRDQRLETEIQQAIEVAKRRQVRQQAIANAANTRYGNREGSGAGSSVAGLTVDRAKGGFTYEGPSLSSRQDGRSSTNGSSQRNPRDTFSASNHGSQPGQPHHGRRTLKDSKGNTQAGQQAHQQISGSYGLQGGAAMGNSLEPIAGSKGQDWALPSRKQGGTVYRRPITIYCSSNQLTVASDANLNQQPLRIPMNAQTAEVLDPLIDSVWKKIESWGIAGAGGYWRPELRIHVEPGADQRARDLSILLQDSGLDLKFFRK